MEKDKKVRKKSTAGFKAFKADYCKEKFSNKEDDTIQAEVDTLASKLAEDPANADAKVLLHDDIQALLKTKKKGVCWSCRSVNCLIKQNMSRRHNIPRKFQGNCKGKQISFKELSVQLKNGKPKSPTAYAQVTSPVSAEYDSDSDEIAQVFADMSKSDDEFCLNSSSVSFFIEDNKDLGKVSPASVKSSEPAPAQKSKKNFTSPSSLSRHHEGY